MIGAALTYLQVRTMCNTWLVVAILLAPFYPFSFSALACPGGLFLEELNPQPGGPRNTMRLWVKDAGPGPASFQTLPLQIDPVDEDGRLIFFEDDNWRQEPVNNFDLLTFRREDFGPRLNWSSEQLPCRGPVTYELINPAMKTYAYLTNCQKSPKGTSLWRHPIAFDTHKHELRGAGYQYGFNIENYMQFRDIKFPKGKDWEDIAVDSRLHIKADVKNFFDMDFDSDDIESDLQSYRLGPVGHLARVSFFLRILFFRISLSLSTDVGFYEDAGHIPMMVNIPVDARKYLNGGSGILYSWAPKAEFKEKKIEMPLFDPKSAKSGYKELAKIGRDNCKKGSCRYYYAAKVGDRSFAMDFILQEELVKKGFFPMFLEDVDAHAKTMGWDMDAKAAKPRVGLYFEVSGLPKGGHPWDFWIRLGGADGSMQVSCPAPIQFTKIPGGVLK